MTELSDAPCFLRKMWGSVCWTDPLSLGDRGDTSITRLIIIIKSEVSAFLIVVIFAVVVCLR